MKAKYIALITARGGSKGLPRKNVLPVNGTPLIGWTIQAALQCTDIGRVFVSTDDSEIAAVSVEYGAEIIQRPHELASDTASSIDVVAHAINWLEDHQIPCSKMTLLQPTSPLRTSRHLQEAIDLFKIKNAKFVISVFEPSHTPIKSYIEREDGSIAGLYNDEAPYTRRQDLPRAFQPNGAIYAFSVEEFKRCKHFPRKGVFPYVMSEVDSADVDTLNDLRVVEQRLKELNND
ncbi:acylneuraminate cytidylyltransferase family protein [Vibrio crassostreae]|uniref:acylneuraminate cytidylyltransferase family protein n=1 Tax=Vibrio crassostreae TaxID=246167 RepID=UPI00200ABA7B|nr:acylneuraminate cytidylyltransferase family protein [Vibrio crassostreae]UPR28453.1 acylneuraminate cytidylyltransferase family protein [Vibrio crassostreae]